jgi:hypothetical protein
MIGTGIGLGLSGFRFQATKNTPELVPGLQFWVDASDSSTLYTDSALTTLAVADGDPVGGWKDKSGNSRNVLQTDGTKKSTLRTAIRNGKNGIRFDGVNDFLTVAMNIRPNEHTVFAVIKKSSSAAVYLCGSADSAANGHSNYFHLGFSGFLTDDIWSIVGNGNSTFKYYKSATGIVGTANAAVCAVNTITNATGTVQDIYVNGSGLSLTFLGSNFTTPIAQNLYNFSVGRLGQYDGGYFQGDLFELIIYNSSLSTTNRQLIESYLRTKWGTP